MTRGREVLSKDVVSRIQEMSYANVPREQIINTLHNETHISKFSLDNGIRNYAPTLVRAGKRRMLQWLKEHPGIDYKDIPFSQLSIAPHTVAAQLYGMRNQLLITFREGKIAPIRGEHYSKGPNASKGIYDIRLTEVGLTRLEEADAKDKATVISKIVGKIKETEKVIQTSSINDEEVVEAPVITYETPVELGPMPEPVAVESPTPEPAPLLNGEAKMHLVDEKYPILSNLRKRQGRINAANRLLAQAMDLYDNADLTDEALQVLEVMRKSEPKMNPVEAELMRLAEDLGI